MATFEPWSNGDLTAHLAANWTVTEDPAALVGFIVSRISFFRCWAIQNAGKIKRDDIFAIVNGLPLGPFLYGEVQDWPDVAFGVFNKLRVPTDIDGINADSETGPSMWVTIDIDEDGKVVPFDFSVSIEPVDCLEIKELSDYHQMKKADGEPPKKKAKRDEDEMLCSQIVFALKAM